VGGVACGPCWEAAIRADERVVVEHDLPRDLDRDPGLVDEVAVRRAARGEVLELTAAERAAVAAARAQTAGPAFWARGRRVRVARSLRAPLGLDDELWAASVEPAVWWGAP
jgi:hypothetical protein